MWLSIVMAMTYVKKNTLKAFWKKDPVFSTSGFADLMTYDRFLVMLKHLRFSDSRTQVEDDKTAKIRKVIDDIRKNFLQNSNHSFISALMKALLYGEVNYYFVNSCLSSVINLE